MMRFRLVRRPALRSGRRLCLRKNRMPDLRCTGASVDWLCVAKNSDQADFFCEEGCHLLSNAFRFAFWRVLLRSILLRNARLFSRISRKPEIRPRLRSISWEYCVASLANDGGFGCCSCILPARSHASTSSDKAYTELRSFPAARWTGKPYNCSQR
jgi:hypothetical protein